jgi:hypothetical protein
MFSIPISALLQRTKPDMSRLAGFDRYNSAYSMGWGMSGNGDPQPEQSQMAAVREKPSIRLDSWKEIASYLLRSERTVRRWEETEDLPVHRQLHERRGSVYAYTDELDSWRLSRSLLESEGADLPEEPLPSLPNAEQTLVKQAPDALVGTGSAPSAAPFGSRRTGSKLWLWSLLALLLGLAAAYIVQQVPRREVPTFTVTPLTTTPGNEVQPSLSPDGDEVAFAYNSDQSSSFHIFVKAIGSDEPVQLTSGSTNDRSPSWSPDGQNITFLRFDSDQSARVMVIPSIGGTARQLTTLRISQRQSEIRVAWSPQNEWIATSDSEQRNQRCHWF